MENKRAMGPKGFLHRANGKAGNSASAFIAQYREWLETGQLAEYTSPILLKLDNEEILPTPALKEIKQAVFNHYLKSELTKAEDAMMKSSESKSKDYRVTIYNAAGEIQTQINSKDEEEELIKGFEKSSEANNWADRRLFDGESDWFAVIEMMNCKDEDDQPLAETILRSGAIARTLKSKKQAISKGKSKSTSKLSFGVKAKQSFAHFSHG